MKKIAAACVAVGLICIIAFVLIYTRPMTIEERCPVLDLSQCTLISGYYSEHDETGKDEKISFAIIPDDPDFQEMIGSFSAAAFKTRLGNILPGGTKIHALQDGDFSWEVMFRFEDVLFPSGSTGSGDMLHISNFFGDIELFFDGQLTKCSVKGQKQWLRDVMTIITRHPG